MGHCSIETQLKIYNLRYYLKWDTENPLTVKKSLHKIEDIANFPSRSFFCYLAREIFLPREGNHFCYFCVFDYICEIIVEILLHHLDHKKKVLLVHNSLMTYLESSQQPFPAGENLYRSSTAVFILRVLESSYYEDCLRYVRRYPRGRQERCGCLRTPPRQTPRSACFWVCHFLIVTISTDGTDDSRVVNTAIRMTKGAPRSSDHTRCRLWPHRHAQHLWFGVVPSSCHPLRRYTCPPWSPTHLMRLPYA